MEAGANSASNLEPRPSPRGLCQGACGDISHDLSPATMCVSCPSTQQSRHTALFFDSISGHECVLVVCNGI